MKGKTKAKEHENEPRDNKTQTSQKTKDMRKTAKHSARRQKLKDAKAVRDNKETGKGVRPKHAGLKPTDVNPPRHKVKLTT